MKNKFLLTKDDNEKAMDEAYDALVGFLDDRMSGERKQRLAPKPEEEPVPEEIQEAHEHADDDTPSEEELEAALQALGD
jgi:hypothetical protein